MANKKPPPTHLFEAAFSLPSADSVLGTVWRAPDGALHIIYIPEEVGVHTLELRFRGVRIGPAQRFDVRPGVPRGKPWGAHNEAEKGAVLSWLSRLLASSGLEAVHALALSSTTFDVPGQRPQCVDEYIDKRGTASAGGKHVLRLLGVVDEGRGETWAAWRAVAQQLKGRVTDVSLEVNSANVEWERGDGQCVTVPSFPDVTRERLQAKYSSAAAIRPGCGMSALPLASTLRDVTTALSDAISSHIANEVAATGSGWTGPEQPVSLHLLAVHEQWARAASGAVTGGGASGAGAATDGVHPGSIVGAVAGSGAGMTSSASSDGKLHIRTGAGDSPVPADGGVAGVDCGHVCAVLLEGYAPAGLRPLVESVLLTEVGRHGGDSWPAAQPVELEQVVWYGSPAQGSLHVRRCAAAHIRGEGSPADSHQWLSETEDFCAHTVAGGLAGLLHRELPGGAVPARRTDWRHGRRTLSSDSPRVELYPHFLSDAEAECMLRLALLLCPPSQPETAPSLPYPSDATSRTTSAPSTAPAAADAFSFSAASPGGVNAGVNTLPAASRRKPPAVLLPPGHPLVDIVEERCSLATGVPRHEHECAVGLKQTVESISPASQLPMVTSLHVDTNNSGTYRCATVIIYLNDVAEGCGGEMRTIGSTPPTPTCTHHPTSPRHTPPHPAAAPAHPQTHHSPPNPNPPLPSSSPHPTPPHHPNPAPTHPNPPHPTPSLPHTYPTLPRLP